MRLARATCFRRALCSTARRGARLFGELTWISLRIHSYIFFLFTNAREGIATGSNAADAWTPTQRVQWVEGGNIFADFSALANEHGAVNLGQGFPSFQVPDFLVQALEESARTQLHHQYTRPGGHPELVSALASFYEPRYGRKLDPLSNVVVCNGAQEGLFVAITTFCEEGDEVVCVEPYFDAYRKAATLVGAVTKGVPLRLDGGESSGPSIDSSAYKLDMSELEAAMSDRTRVLVLNTPHNPTGKAFTREELEQIAAVAKRFPRCLIFSDEVYEAMCYDDAVHQRMCTLPDMWDRTVTFYSAGKTFSCTGWRVGYMTGPSRLCQPLVKAQGVVAFCAATPLEVAIAKAFAMAENNGYFESLPRTLQAKRDALATGLRGAGFRVHVPQGGYFIMADGAASSFASAEKLNSTGEVDSPDTPLADRQDVRMARALTVEAGVTAIPPSPFYSPQYRHLAENMLRFCFCKEDADIKEATKRLAHTA